MKLIIAAARKRRESTARTRREIVRTRESRSTTKINPIAVRHTPTMVVAVAKRVRWCVNARSTSSALSGDVDDDDRMTLVRCQCHSLDAWPMPREKSLVRGSLHRHGEHDAAFRSAAPRSTISGGEAQWHVAQTASAARRRLVPCIHVPGAHADAEHALCEIQVVCVADGRRRYPPLRSGRMCRRKREESQRRLYGPRSFARGRSCGCTCDCRRCGRCGAEPPWLGPVPRRL